MTVTFYKIVFRDYDGKRLVGQIYWDKNNQGSILASLCPEVRPGYLDYPVWSSSVSYGGELAVTILRRRLVDKATRASLCLVEESKTQYFPPRPFSPVTKQEKN